MSAAEDFINSFTGAIVNRDFAGAETMLAPWLRANLAGGKLKQVLRQARGTAPPPFEADSPSLLPYNTPASLREDNGKPIAAEITGANYRGAWRVEFVPDPDLEAEVDFSYALFLVVVDLDSGLAIGYLEPAE